MPATSSLVPATKSALVARLAAREGLADVQVGYAWPGPETDLESIFLDPPEEALTSQSDAPVLAGADREEREETFPIHVLVQVIDRDAGVDGAAAVEARCFALLAEVEDELATRIRGQLPLNVDGLQSVRLGSHVRVLVPSGSGWMAQVVARVDCVARLA